MWQKYIRADNGKQSPSPMEFSDIQTSHSYRINDENRQLVKNTRSSFSCNNNVDIRLLLALTKNLLKKNHVKKNLVIIETRGPRSLVFNIINVLKKYDGNATRRSPYTYDRSQSHACRFIATISQRRVRRRRATNRCRLPSRGRCTYMHNETNCTTFCATH